MSAILAIFNDGMSLETPPLSQLLNSTFKEKKEKKKERKEEKETILLVIASH